MPLGVNHLSTPLQSSFDDRVFSLDLSLETLSLTFLRSSRPSSLIRAKKESISLSKTSLGKRGMMSETNLTKY